MSSVTFLIVACMIFCCGFVGSTSCTAGRQFPFARLILLHDQPPDAREKTRDAFHAFHAPRLHLFERPHEHLVTTERVRAVDFDHVERIDHVAPALRHFAVVLAEDHPLVDQALERLGLRDVAEIEEHLVPEPRVEEMQHRVLDAADVEIDAARLARRPSSNAPASSPTKRCVVLRIAEAQVIPARAGPLRHGVRFARRVFRIANPVFRFGQRRLAGAGRFEIFERGRLERQLRFRQRLMFSIAPDDRERLAPIALPREKPVAQLVTNVRGGRGRFAPASR